VPQHPGQQILGVGPHSIIGGRRIFLRAIFDWFAGYRSEKGAKFGKAPLPALALMQPSFTCRYPHSITLR